MSIIVIQEPPAFQPVLTNGLFYTISADTTNNYQFRYTYDVYIDGTLEFSAKATPNPYGRGIVDVSRILKTYCLNNPISLWNTTEIYQHQTFPFSRPSQKETINYQVYFGYEYASTELGAVTAFTGNGLVEGNPGVSSPLKKVFKSTMGVNGRATQQDFNMGPFVLSGSPTTSNPTTSGLFLTNSPRTRNIQESEYYTLAFTNYYLDNSTISEPYYVKYTFYDDQGVTLTAVTVDNITTNGGGPRTGCTQVYQSLPYIIPSGNTNYNTLYVGAGPVNLQDIIPANTAQYTVQLFGKFTGTTTPIQPTPTPTPTPSSTPASCACLTYEVTNNSLEAQGIFTYRNCQNIETQLVLNPFETFYVCVCNTGNWTIEGNLSVIYDSPCVQTTPTPTPTPSATPCACGEYEIDNSSATSGATISYTFCDGTPLTYNLTPSENVFICGCVSSFTATSGSSYTSITYAGPC